MINLLSANVLGIAVGIVVALIVVGGFGLYFYRKIKAKKSGKGGCCCSGDCSSCSCCSFSFKPREKEENLDKQETENSAHN